MLPRPSELHVGLGASWRLKPSYAQVIVLLGIVLAALLAWGPLRLEWLALVDISALALWSTSSNRWLATSAAIASAWGSALHGIELPPYPELVRLLGFSAVSVLVAYLPLRLARRSLRQRDETYRHIVDCVPACVCVADRNGDIVYANKVATEALGAPAENILGKGWLDFLHPDSLPPAVEAWSTSIRTHCPLDVALQFRRHDGAYRWQHLTANPQRDAAGEVISWYMIGVDIQAQVEAQQALNASKHELAKIIETLPLGIWCTSAEGQPTYMNRRLRAYSGSTLDLASDWKWAEFIHPDDRAATAAAFAQAINTGSSYLFTHRLRGIDGQYRWYEERAEAFRDAAGRIQRWYGVAIDVDDQVRTEERLRETRANLARATRVATLAELSASIAHELNQPLTAIIANAQAGRRWLAATPPNVEQAAKSVNMILRDGRAADDTMQNIRALFKRESIRRSPTRVEEMVWEAVRLVHEDSQRKNVPVTCQFAPSLPMVLADRVQIQQVLINLICNGIEAAESLGRPAQLKISARTCSDRILRIEVVDNGPGVGDPVGIFDAFVTTKPAGMGIGLAISRSIALAHDGQLSVRNPRSGGACFSLDLPTA